MTESNTLSAYGNCAMTMPRLMATEASAAVSLFTDPLYSRKTNFNR